MYLSRVFLNPLRRATRELAASPQRMHAAVLGGFAAGPSTDGGRVLWRLDRSAHRLELYVVSVDRPDFIHLVENAGWSTSQPDVTEYGRFLDRISVSQRFIFRLRANTVRSTKDGVGERERGRVVNVGSRQHQEDWLLARAASLGFAIPDDPSDITALDGEVLGRRNLVLTSRDTLRFARRSDGTRRDVTLSTAQFDGVLEVTEPDALRTALCVGIGRGKAYGCGLMTLAPLG